MHQSPYVSMSAVGGWHRRKPERLHIAHSKGASRLFGLTIDDPRERTDGCGLCVVPATRNAARIRSPYVGEHRRGRKSDW
ncbi:hypothetical protein OH77DRAFT_1420849 [Trametes cingulata]|nr:hypothetical protein OH77DRAFT_1420849 [Trametes cingulata]